MSPDDEVCLCFHVTRRKVLSFLRVEKPTRPSQLSQCYGAGTGCGWCRPYLERLFHKQQTELKALAENGTSAEGAFHPDVNRVAGLPQVEPISVSGDSPDASKLGSPEVTDLSVADGQSAPSVDPLETWSPVAYAEQRQQYIRQGYGKPPTPS